MHARILFTFILFSLSSAMTENEVSEHEKFSNEYHKILRKSLAETSQVFQSLDYDIKDGKYNMKWEHHKKIPTLQFDFDVIVNQQQVCHLQFELDSHLAHVPETIQQQGSSEEVAKIVEEIRKCGEKILNNNQPEQTNSLREDVLSDFESHLDQSISEESRKSVESALQNKLDQYENRQNNIEFESSSLESSEEINDLNSIMSSPKNNQFLNSLSSDELENINPSSPPLIKKKAVIYERSTCDTHIKEIVKTHIKNLVFQNLLQDVKIFDENIKECGHKQENNRVVYDSVLQFNREKCFLRTKLQEGQIQVMKNEYQESQFMFDLNQGEMINCAERFATIELLTK